LGVVRWESSVGESGIIDLDFNDGEWSVGSRELGECGIIDLDFNDGEWSVVRRPLGNVELLTLTLIMGSGPWGVGECGIIDLDSIVPIQPETIGLRRRAIENRKGRSKLVFQLILLSCSSQFN
jgi:hypothetical protein